MYPWHRILIPTDFSTASEWVFDDAVRIAGSTGAEIIILHVRMTRSSNPDQLRFPADESLYDYVERIELDKLRERVKQANATVPARMVVTSAPEPGPEISRIAAAEPVDLIVMATHARHHVAHLFVGSTTQGVITSSPAPLLAIRYGIHKRRELRRIIVPVHARQTSHAALALAAAIARRERGEVHLITVCRDEERAGAEALLNSLAAEVAAGVTVKRTVATGTDIDPEVVRVTERADADAIFVNAADAPSQLKLDIIRHAPVPVMIVPTAQTSS